MKQETGIPIWVIISFFLVLIFFFTVLMIKDLPSKRGSCEDRGGVEVKTRGKWICIKKDTLLEKEI